MKQKLFSMLALLLMAATGAWAQSYTVTLKSGTEDADKWTIEPKEGLSENDQVTITYTGSKRVKDVKAVKKAAVETMEFVEFTNGGKKVKFANMNLGATSVADGTKSYGDYYAWGATETFATVDYSTATPTVTAKNNGGYILANGPFYSGSAYTKYNSTDNRITLEAADDAVTAKMGEGYRMPTSEDFQTLYAACGGTGDHMDPSSISDGAAYEQGIYWVEGAETAVTVGSDEYKANGVLFVQDATHHIFFPAAGEFNGTSLKFAGVVGHCWSSSFYTADANKAHYLFLNSVYVSPVDKYLRYRGYPIRPVQVVAPDGAINGRFSVSATKKVYFSKGNLRYASGAWSFFDNQYDYYSSYSADAWDKFGWSTSATTYGMNTSTESSTYSGSFVDWGAMMGTGWFTLTSDEWTYLFNTRSASTVGGTDNGRYAKAKVNNVQGIILFPDTYTHPDGVTAPVGVNAVDATGWNGNNYSSADWTKMESAGCVFLPAAGYRNGSSMEKPGTVGYYWSATPNGSGNPYYVRSNSDALNPASWEYRNRGYSVRLVQEVAPTPATITVTWNNSDISSSGTSFTKDGVTMNVTGVLCDFSNKNFSGGTFTSTVGNFTKIEVTANNFENMGSGWSGSSGKATWTGTASSTVSFGGSDPMDGIWGMGDTKFVFTIEPTN